MRASQHHHAPPQPLPLPPPPLSLPSPPAAPRRRRGRHRSSHSSSSSSSSSISGASASSTFFCPSPSLFPVPSPRSSTTSLVPFSWEHQPGVPKNSSRGGRASPTAGTPLPLPPPLLGPAPRRRPRRRQRDKAKPPAASLSSSDVRDDPFVAAFAECTRDDDDGYATADDGNEDDSNKKLWPVPAKPARVSSGRWRIGGGGGLVAFLDMYGCKSAMDVVADSAFHSRRIVAAANPSRPVVRRETSR